MKRRTSRAARLVVACIVLGLPLSSAAQAPRSFLIEPAESSVSVGGGSRLLLDFGLLGGPVELPIAAEGPAATALRGVLLARVGRNPLSPSLLIEPTGSLVVPANSGDLLPGLPADPASPAPGQLAASFAEALFGIQGTAAIRGSAFRLSGSYSMEELEPGRYAFPVVQPGFPQPSLVVTVGRGDADIELGALGLSGRTPLAGFGFGPGLPAGGVLEDLGDDRLRLTIPLDLDVTLRPFLAGPMTLEIRLAGQIVAYSPVLPVPEVGAWLGTLAGVFVLAGLRRLRGGEAA